MYSCILSILLCNFFAEYKHILRGRYVIFCEVDTNNYTIILHMGGREL